MKFNAKEFKKNIIFFIICFVVMIVLILICDTTAPSSTISKEDLGDKEISIDKLIISEVMTSNNGVIADAEGKIYDYIEIYNGNENDIPLKNYGLSDEDTGVKWTFPDVTIKSKSYMIVYLSGTRKDGLYTPFKLKSSGGEVVGLFKPNGKIIDAVETVALESNNVMARNAEGKWVIQEKATPGYANTIDGQKQFIDSLVKEDSTLVINEILADNKGNFKNENGEYTGYIEIKNIGKEKINLLNYGLSDSEDENFKWQFPDISIAPGDVLLIYASGTSSKQGVLSTSFKLSNKNGVAILTNNKGQVISKLKYENLSNGIAYIRQGENYLESNSISPGYDNTVDGIKAFQKKYLKLEKDLIITEAMNSNYKHLPQNGGEYYDWIELYNNSGKTIKLSDYCLTNNTNTMCLYKLPNVELKDDAYYVIMASGETNLSNKSYKHTNFKLSTSESIYVTKSSKIIDSMHLANIPKGYSMGKGSSYGLYYFSSPTPGKKNGNGTEAVSYTPVPSQASGVFNDVKSVKVALKGNGKIYYTLDGSDPTTSSKVYSSPLTIKKTTVLRIMSKESGKLASPIESYTYIINENHTLPVMSVTIDPDDLQDLHNHAWTEGYIEQAYAELIELDGSGFKIPAGLKLFGGSTRGHAKKSYELKFKKEYGAAELHYKVFEHVDSSVFNSIVLRSGSQDEMGNDSKKALIRDIVATSLVREHTSVDVQDYKTVVMYLNGKYWGLYWLREKVDETFVGNHYNVNATKKNTDILRIDSQVKSGSASKYNKMISFISNNSLSSKSNYEKIKQQIDIENLCDFWIAETWTANNDIVNTRYFSHPDVDGGKWKFIFYDLDYGFYNVNKNYYQFSTSSYGMTVNGYSTFLLRNLMKNSEFKKTYLERLSYNLKNTWSKDLVTKKIDDVIKEIGEKEILRNLERWDFDEDFWRKNIKWLKEYASKRNGYMVSQAKSFFGLSDSEVKKYFGGVK